MYARKENITEESLDWDESQKKADQAETETQSKESKHIIHPATIQNRVVFQKKIKLSQLNVKNTIKNILDEHGELSLFLALLTLPYIIGFVIVSFVLLYGGVPIDRFFSLREGVFHFELWSIGAYISITAGVIWLVALLFMQRR